MEKFELLEEVKILASQSLVSSEELMQAFNDGQGKKIPATSRKLNTAQLLYYIGGAIVFLGLVILVGQNWDFFNSFTKIIITLGSALAAFAVGVILARTEKYEGMGQAFFLLSALLSPLGVFVTFDQMGISPEGYGMQSVISAILLVFYFSSYFIYKRSLFLLFAVFFGSWLFFSLTDFLFQNSVPFDFKFFEYRALIVGLSYMLLGYALSVGENKVLTGVLYGFGSLGFLTAAVALQGWKPLELSGILWEVAFPFIAMAFILLSTKLKSRSFLVFGSLFLMGYVLKITSEYFADSLGWPLALVIAGFGMIGVGYLTVYIKRKNAAQTI